MCVYVCLCGCRCVFVIVNVYVWVCLYVYMQVAARVRTEDGEEQWILAEVVSYNSHNHRYIVDDIDEEGHNEKRCEKRWEGLGC